MRRISVKKASILRRHARQRASERYGLWLNREQLEDAVKQIQSGQGKFLGRTSNNRSHWLLTIHGTACHVVYDRQRKSVVTFLPMEIVNGQTSGAEDSPRNTE